MYVCQLSEEEKQAIKNKLLAFYIHEGIKDIRGAIAVAMCSKVSEVMELLEA